METPRKRSSRARNSSSKAASSPISSSAPKEKSTPNSKSSSRTMRPRAKISYNLNPATKSGPESEAIQAIQATHPSRMAKPEITSQPNSNSSTAVSPKAISNAIASLSFQYQVPITISQDDNDQKIIRNVMEMYISDGAKNWDTDTKIAFVKALSLIKTTPSAESITSNHAIWRVVTRRKEGWNWAYWLVFRAIYGKAVLENHVHVTNAIQTMYPNTDIWSAITPSTLVVPTTPDSCPVARASNRRDSSGRKRPHRHTLDDCSGVLGQSMAPRSKRRRLEAIAQPPRVLSLPGSSKDGDGNNKHTTLQERNVNEASTSDKGPSTVAVVNASPETKTLVQQTEIILETHQGKECTNFPPVLPEVDITTQEAEVVANNTDAAIGDIGANLDTAEATNKSSAPSTDHDSILQIQKMRDELSAQFSAQLQASEERTQNRIEALTKTLPSSCHAGQLFAEILSIKQCLLALEEANQVRISDAATFNIPATLNADTRKALEALGHQVQKCTRDIYQLRTGQLYEEDPMLSRIKREPVLDKHGSEQV